MHLSASRRNPVPMKASDHGPSAVRMSDEPRGSNTGPFVPDEPSSIRKIRRYLGV